MSQSALPFSTEEVNTCMVCISCVETLRYSRGFVYWLFKRVNHRISTAGRWGQAGLKCGERRDPGVPGSLIRLPFPVRRVPPRGSPGCSRGVRASRFAVTGSRAQARTGDGPALRAACAHMHAQTCRRLFTFYVVCVRRERSTGYDPSGFENVLLFVELSVELCSRSRRSEG